MLEVLGTFIVMKICVCYSNIYEENKQKKIVRKTTNYVSCFGTYRI